ncbi:ATP-binding protein [Sphingomonas colocasiae]|uniref:histidine kinase n=1 Tax=Sphingomonas colocasiae TaxID=1848973 RepID=A0ABS7PX47_9SPHN|nr:ATP-binding protein [Sphingomonas colocasiae]MBY8825935.1 response regulator [Sphingomonas colocasiae]
MAAAEDFEPGNEDAPRSGWQRWLGWIAAAIVVASLAGLVVMLGISSTQRDTALAQQEHSFEVMIAVRGIEGQMTNAEAVLGRAVIASDKRIARQFYDEWRRTGVMIERLARLARDNPDQAALVKALRSLYRTRSEELEAAALHLNYDQKVQALSAYFAAGKTDSIARTKAIFREIVRNEEALLATRAGDAQGFLQQANRLAATLAVLGLLLVAALIALGWITIEVIGQRRRARRRADAESLRAEVLEAAVAERTAELRLANQHLLTEAAERAQAEAQLRQIQKMEAVGQLTGGIAHDFNNMLAVVVGGLELAKRKLHNHAADAERHIDNAMEGANRAAALTRRLLAFARAEPLLPQAVSPDTLVTGMTDLMDRTLGERIQLAFETVPGLWPIWVDRHQLENAILNLAVNARDAMEHGGRLTIRTSNAVLAADEVGESPPGDYVRIDVSDTGAGMTPEILDRVFEPFFTTKPVGKGTGLGLSQIFGFVRQSGGEVAIASTPGAGTTVSLYLPRHHVYGTDLPETEETPTVADSQPLANDHVALIVEDDPRVLIATAGALEELGFETLRATGGEEAILRLASDPRIDIIVTDVVMPGMTGPELIAEIAPLYPEIAVLFVTGYADVEDAAAFRGHAVLRKPYTIGALKAAVEAALSGSRPAPEAEAAE